MCIVVNCDVWCSEFICMTMCEQCVRYAWCDCVSYICIVMWWAFTGMIEFGILLCYTMLHVIPSICVLNIDELGNEMILVWCIHVNSATVVMPMR